MHLYCKTLARLASLLALAASSTALAEAPPPNFIIVVPQALPASAVDLVTAPALTKLRAEGVYFMNSHAGFPPLDGAPVARSGGFDAGTLVTLLNAASSKEGDRQYSTAVIDERREPDDQGGSQLPAIIRDVLPRLKAEGRPFVLVYELAGVTQDFVQQDPATSASAMKASAPGTNTPDDKVAPLMLTTLAADDAVAAIERALQTLGLFETTNIIVAARHGSTSVWKDSYTSVSADLDRQGRPSRNLPPGFLSIDLTAALSTQDAAVSLFDPDNGTRLVDWQKGEYPAQGNAIIAVHPSDPQVLVLARGSYDLLFLPERFSRSQASRLARQLVDELTMQDYVSGLFVNEERVGRVKGALSLKHLAFSRNTFAPMPDMVVSFVSLSSNCDRPTVCTLTIADTPLRSGQPLPGRFSRAGTWNFMAARGPSFRQRLISRTPASSVDIARTIAELWRVAWRDSDVPINARVLTETLSGSSGKATPRVRSRVIASKPTARGDVTEIHLQIVGSTTYFDAAGFAGWAVGVPPRPEPVEWRFWRWDWPRPKRLTIEITPE